MNAPEPEHIAISKSKGIKIDWKDGHRSDYALAYLRDECPCATCTGAHGTTPEKTNYSAPKRRPVPDVHADAQDAERGAGGRLRHPHRLERRARIGNLFFRLPGRGIYLHRVRRADFSRAQVFSPALPSGLRSRSGTCPRWGVVCGQAFSRALAPIQTSPDHFPATTVATGPPLNDFPSNGELRLFENDLFTS